MQRLISPESEGDNPASPALAALERAEEALAEAETLLSRLAAEADADPRLLENAEERLFALRAAARKHGVPVGELADLRRVTEARAWPPWTMATPQIGTLMRRKQAAARTLYHRVRQPGSRRRAGQRAATRLEKAKSAANLPPLRGSKRPGFLRLSHGWRRRPGGQAGADSVRFLIATNPGQAPGPLGRIASGGELSRLMLALKVVLVSGSPVPTLVFDEVDSGIGGATAAAVGERLSRVAAGVQVLVVTHSPQVAARGAVHLRVSKQAHERAAPRRVWPASPPASGARRLPACWRARR